MLWKIASRDLERRSVFYKSIGLIMDHVRADIMKALNDVVDPGKVQEYASQGSKSLDSGPSLIWSTSYIGASSIYTWEFQMLQNIVAKRGWHKLIPTQSFYNLLYREEDREMIPYCNDTGLGFIPWLPMARGSLARSWGERISKREGSGERRLPDRAMPCSTILSR